MSCPPAPHHTPHLRFVCCEVLSASRDCGFLGCDGILGIRMTDPQAGRRRWSWLISAISQVGLLWWRGSCRHHFSTSPDFSVRRPPCLCCNLGSSCTHAREGWCQWRTRWSSRRVRWVWVCVAAGGRAWVDRLSIATASPEMRCAIAVPGRDYQPNRTAHGRSTTNRVQWLSEQSAWRAMGAVRWDGDMARHLGTRSEYASHQTQLGSGSSLAASAQPTQPPTPPWTDAGQTCLSVVAQRCAVSAESVSVASTTADQHTCGWTCGWSCGRPWVGRCVLVLCSGELWLVRGLRQAVCGVWWPGRTALRPPPPRHARHHAHRHGPVVLRRPHEHSERPCGHGLRLWVVGLAAQHRRAPPPRQSSPPPSAVGAAHILSGLSRLKSHAAPLESRFAVQRLALALVRGGGDNQGVCDVTIACGLGRGGPEGVWVTPAASPRPPQAATVRAAPITARRAS